MAVSVDVLGPDTRTRPNEAVNSGRRKERSHEDGVVLGSFPEMVGYLKGGYDFTDGRVVERKLWERERADVPFRVKRDSLVQERVFDAIKCARERASLELLVENGKVLTLEEGASFDQILARGSLAFEQAKVLSWMFDHKRELVAGGLVAAVVLDMTAKELFTSNPSLTSSGLGQAGSSESGAFNVNRGIGSVPESVVTPDDRDAALFSQAVTALRENGHLGADVPELKHFQVENGDRLPTGVVDISERDKLQFVVSGFMDARQLWTTADGEIHFILQVFGQDGQPINVELSLGTSHNSIGFIEVPGGNIGGNNLQAQQIEAISLILGDTDPLEAGNRPDLLKKPFDTGSQIVVVASVSKDSLDIVDRFLLDQYLKTGKPSGSLKLGEVDVMAAFE